MMIDKLTCGALFIFALLALGSCQPHSQREDQHCTYVHQYGVPVGSEQWIKSGCNGQKIISWRDGVTVSQTYVNGLLHGPSTYSYPLSEKIERVEEYINNHLTKQLFYDTEGNPKRSIAYKASNVRTVTSWYDIGNPCSIETYEGSLLISGKYYTLMNVKDSWVYKGDGERVTRDEYGHTISLDTFKEGIMVSSTTYYSNGSPREISYFDQGARHGEQKRYYLGGEPMCFETWEKGEKTGMTTLFQEGVKFAEVPYVAGKKNGLERRYRDGIVVNQEICWKDDKMHGPASTYSDGGIVQTDWYYKGRLTSQANFESYAVPKGKSHVRKDRI